MAKSKHKPKFEKSINVVPITEKQKEFFDAIKSNQMVVALGCAGTGKTYIPVALAAKALEKGEIEKIILTKPNVGAGGTLGYVPGTLEEKFQVWVAEPLAILEELFGSNALECKLKNKSIEIIPFEVMRGRTFDDAFIILDEAQNVTETQMELFTTRMGERTKIIVNGDITQDDLRISNTGMVSLLELIDLYGMKIPIIEFTPEDTVRSGLCREFTINWARWKDEN